jgi:hypothetical protein
VAADAREYFGPKVYESVIPRNVRLAEAPSFGKPIILYDVTSAGAQAYMSVARELLVRHRPQPTTRAGAHASATAAQRDDRPLPVEADAGEPEAVDPSAAAMFHVKHQRPAPAPPEHGA